MPGPKLKFRTDVLAVEVMALSGMNAYRHRYLFVDQDSTDTVAWAKFLDKVTLVTPDNDLRLAIHIEQAGAANDSFMHF